jgi:hypothetical protein
MAPSGHDQLSPDVDQRREYRLVRGGERTEPDELATAARAAVLNPRVFTKYRFEYVSPVAWMTISPDLVWTLDFSLANRGRTEERFAILNDRVPLRTRSAVILQRRHQVLSGPRLLGQFVVHQPRWRRRGRRGSIPPHGTSSRRSISTSTRRTAPSPRRTRTSTSVAATSRSSSCPASSCHR